jgi:hypothetical protein
MQSRDDAEKALALVVSNTTRTYLQQVLDEVVLAIKAGRFDDAQPVLALGVLLGWWTDAVGESVVEQIKESWAAAFGVTSEGRVAVTPRDDAMAFHLAAVKDRLSRSALPEIPEAAFDEVRLSQSAAALGGWDTEHQGRDIAERLAWEPDKAYWQQAKADAEAEIDKILDPLGRPGTPARTYAHKNDPQVKVWQEVRARAVDKIKEHEGDWKVRATRIARTEATSAWNSGSLAALASEGRTHKKWVATTKGRNAHRTRDSHREAHGQVVPLSRPFKVGKSLLMAPGDPSAPPWETINCFVDGQVVEARNIVSGYSREYSGDIVHVTAAGVDVLSGTPNHPVLTLRGWVPLGLLEEGDRLVGCRFREDVPVGHPDVEDVPATIEQVVAALAELSAPRRVVGVGVQFHGDPGQGEVDVVRPDRPLWVSDEPLVSKPVGEQAFARGDLTAAGLGLLREFFVAGVLPAAAVPGVLQVARSEFDAAFEQAATDHELVEAKITADLFDGGPVEVTLHDVVNVHVESGWHGRVSNLETASGWYTNSTIICHNCRCTVVGADAPEQAALTAAANESWRRQIRVPKGNGPLSGRWVDMPGKVVEDLLHKVNETPIDDQALGKIMDALEEAKAWDPADPDTHDRLDDVLSYLMDATATRDEDIGNEIAKA